VAEGHKSTDCPITDLFDLWAGTCRFHPVSPTAAISERRTLTYSGEIESIKHA